MGLTKLEHTIQVPITVTENNVIGPTSDTTYRNNINLPWPLARSTGANNTIDTDANANTIYIDPVNGVDTNTGTNLSSDAVKTIGRAWALVTATRHTIHIEVLGAPVGTAWTLSQNWTAIANNTNVLRIQCAAGQTGTITTTGYDTDGPFPPHGTGIIRALNGIHFVHNHDSSQATIPYVIRLAGTANIDVRWCSFAADIPSTPNGSVYSGHLLLAAPTAAVTVTVKDTLFKLSTSGGITLAIPIGSLHVIENNIFDGRYVVTLPTNAAMHIQSAGITSTVRFRHNTVFNQHFAIFDTGAAKTWDIHSNIFDSIAQLGSAAPAPPTYAITNSLINATTFSTVDVSSTTNVFNRNPLYIDAINGDYRLRHKGRITASGRAYLSNSPAVGIGTSGTDAGAYDVTYTEGAETSTIFEFLEGDGWAVAGQLVRVNYQAFHNILGDFSCTWDGEKWALSFSFTGDYWQGHDQTAQFLLLFRSRTLVRYYPAGDDGLWDASGVAITITSATVVDTGTNIPPRLLPDNTVLPGSDQVIPDYYIGWVMRIQWTDGGAMEGYFEIISHTESAWTLSWIRGDSNLLSGTGFTANIMYLPCQLDMGEIAVDVPYVSTCDTKPETWHAPQGSVTIAGYQTEESHFRDFKLMQTRELPN